MNHHLNVNRTGLVFAILVGGINLLWAILVAVGLAQAWVSFVFRLHSIVSPAPMVGPFDLLNALLLVVVAFAVGYVLGAVFAFIWNKVYAERTPEVTIRTRAPSTTV